MAPSWVVIGQFASQYGVVWAMYMCGGKVSLSLCTPPCWLVCLFYCFL